MKVKEDLNREFLVREYWDKKKSLKQIADDFGLCPNSIVYAMKKQGIARRTVSEGVRLHPGILNLVKLDVGQDMAYILGAYLGDGCALVNGGRYTFRLKGERQFTGKVSQALSAIGLHPHLRDEGNYFMVEASGRDFILWLKELDLDILRNLLVTDILKVNFIQGFYDAEGCLTIYKKPQRAFPGVQVRIGNTNLKLLQFCQTLLRDLHVYSKIELSYKEKGSHHAYYFLRMASYYWAKIFLTKIVSSIPHKTLEALQTKLLSFPKPTRKISPRRRTLQIAWGA